MATAARPRRRAAPTLLEALGANLQLTPEEVAECVAATGIGFMFAPAHHGAMKNVAAVRKGIGVRTIFNILGPLTNPAGAANQLMGVFHPDLVGIQVRVLERLGSRHVLVVHGKDGMDEASLGAATMVGELKDGVVREYEIHPEDYGLSMMSNRGIKVSNREESRALVIEALDNVDGVARDIVGPECGPGHLPPATRRIPSPKRWPWHLKRFLTARPVPSWKNSALYPEIPEMNDILAKNTRRQGRGSGYRTAEMRSEGQVLLPRAGLAFSGYTGFAQAIEDKDQPGQGGRHRGNQEASPSKGRAAQKISTGRIADPMRTA